MGVRAELVDQMGVLFVKFENAAFNTVLVDGPRSSVTLDDNIVRFGVNYRFGGPAVARY